ncbi:MAG: hypothetical protein EZS28_010701 [Streblomastix strix]|uniref:Uncharacterized protein n=1 Tax=Streblomastix strix TaxID=222440 RepID=A0A5J4WFL5_9EUKA|nr:MAG: hypothetical protein EZS28_010701 [Streblomastix strix]
MCDTANHVGLAFLEVFILAMSVTERRVALGQLTPMSEEYLYYAILNEQLANPESASAEELRLTSTITQQFGKANDLVKLMTLQIGPNTSSNKEELPTKLDQSLVSLNKQIETLLKDNQFISRLTSEGIYTLPKIEMDQSQLLQFINNLPLCTYPLTVTYILEYLQQGGNWYEISLQLSVEQLEQIASVNKGILGDYNFVIHLLQGQFGTSEEDLDTDIISAKKLYGKIWNIAQ